MNIRNMLLGADERSSDSYIGRDDFLSLFRKSPRISSDSNLVFHGFTFGFFFYLN